MFPAVVADWTLCLLLGKGFTEYRSSVFYKDLQLTFNVLNAYHGLITDPILPVQFLKFVLI